MSGEKSSHDGMLYPQFVNFDPHNPPACFSKAQIDYLLSVDGVLCNDEAKTLHELEQFKIDRLNNVAFGRELPGVRPRDSRTVMYVENNTGLAYMKFSERFLDRVLGPHFDISSHKFIKSGYRIQTSDNNRYYAFHFNNNQGRWREKMQTASACIGAKTGNFNQGLFVVSSGEIFPFSSLKIDWADGEIADDW